MTDIKISVEKPLDEKKEEKNEAILVEVVYENKFPFTNIFPMSTRTLMTRSWKHVCLLCVSSYTILQLIMGLDNMYSSNPVCHFAPFASWLWYPNILEATFFMSSVILNAVRLTYSRHLYDNIFSTFMFCTFLNSMAGCTSLLILTSGWGGVCKDSFGIYSYAAEWVDWLVLVPFLYFIAFAVDDSTSLTYDEKRIVGYSWLMILSGFLMVLRGPLWISCFLFALVIILFGSIMYMVTFGDTLDDRPSNLQNESLHPPPRPASVNLLLYPNDPIIFNTDIKKQQLSRCLSYTMPLYFIAYIFCLSGLITNDLYTVILWGCNVLCKIIFASIAMDVHLQANHRQTNTYINERRYNLSKRLLSKHISNRMVDPMNTMIQSSKQLIESDVLLQQSDLFELTKVIYETTEFLQVYLHGMTLIHNQGLHNIEIQRTEVIIIRNLLRSIANSFHLKIYQKNLGLRVKVHSKVPFSVKGDGAKLSYILVNILDNAIKFTENDKSICVEVYTNERRAPSVIHMNILQRSGSDIQFNDIHTNHQQWNTNVDIVFKITDEGIGFSSEQISTFFEIKDYSSLASLGTSMESGLYICQAIVTAYGGYMHAISTEPCGTTVLITIPFQIHHISAPLDPESTPKQQPPVPSTSPLVTTAPLGRPVERYECKPDVYSESTGMVDRHSATAGVISLRDLCQRRRLGIIDEMEEEDYMEEQSMSMNLQLAVPNNELDMQDVDNVNGNRDYKIDVLMQPSPNYYDAADYSSLEESTSLGLRKRHSESLNSVGSTRVEEANASQSDDMALEDFPAPASLRVLVIDASDSHNTILSRIFQYKNCQCDCEVNLDLAYRLISDQPEFYDLVLVDSNARRPGISGVRLTELVRKLGYDRVMIGMASSAYDQEMGGFMVAGADSVLAKPLMLDQIYKLVEFLQLSGCSSERNRTLTFSEQSWLWVSK